MAADGDKLFRRVARLNQVSREAADALKEARETPQPLAAVDQAKARDRDAQQGLINALWNEQEARHQHWSDVRAERDQGREERGQTPGAPGDVLFNRVEWRRQAMNRAEHDLQTTRDEVRFPRDVADLDLAQEIYMEMHADYANDLFDNQDAREAHWNDTRMEVEGYRQEQAEQQRLEQERAAQAEPKVETDHERFMRQAYERQQEELRQERDGPEWGMER